MSNVCVRRINTKLICRFKCEILMTLSNRTRMDIIHFLRSENIIWNGALDEVDFLSRIYDLDSLPSYDSRFKNAGGDIRQHRVFNKDWAEDWIYDDNRFNLKHCSDEQFLNFLAEMLHPTVRRNEDETNKLLAALNRRLGEDGYKLVEKKTEFGNIRYEAEGLFPATIESLEELRNIANQLSSEHLQKEIVRMKSYIETDPALAIGTSKEFIETICKTVLKERGIQLSGKENLPELTRLTRTELFDCGSIKRDKVTEDKVDKVLGAMSFIIQNIGEFRNAYGTGHGKDIGTEPPDPIYATLIVNAATTIGFFFYQLHENSTVH